MHRDPKFNVLRPLVVPNAMMLVVEYAPHPLPRGTSTLATIAPMPSHTPRTLTLHRTQIHANRISKRQSRFVLPRRNAPCCTCYRRPPASQSRKCVVAPYSLDLFVLTPDLLHRPENMRQSSIATAAILPGLLLNSMDTVLDGVAVLPCEYLGMVAWMTVAASSAIRLGTQLSPCPSPALFLVAVLGWTEVYRW